MSTDQICTSSSTVERIKSTPQCSCTFTVANANNMLSLGEHIASLLLPFAHIRHIFLYGHLGSGKTTFTRGFVQKLPQGHLAEISSPSFTICNNYPTNPTVLHYDFFRAESISSFELEEFFDTLSTMVIVEWAEHLPKDCIPQEHLALSFTLNTDETRNVICTHYAPSKNAFTYKLLQHQQNIQNAIKP